MQQAELNFFNKQTIDTYEQSIVNVRAKQNMMQESCFSGFTERLTGKERPNSAVRHGELMREKITSYDITSKIDIQESKLISFDRVTSTDHSFRIYRDGFAGIYYTNGVISEEDGYARAEKNLELKRPYGFSPETGKCHRDKTEREMSDSELMEVAKKVIEYLNAKYPEFIYSGEVSKSDTRECMENENGLDYSNRDSCTSVDISYKHKDSKNINDGVFRISLRNFEFEKFVEMADNYLGNYNTMLELPEQLIIQMQYYGLIGKIKESLNGEDISLGTSLFTGKIGQKLFSESFSLTHDVSDKETWFSPFFDGEGVVMKDNRLPYIEKGVILRGYSDKKTAEKYGIEHTGSAWRNYSDIPSNGNVNLIIERSTKTIRELLDGRLSVVPVVYSGGGFNEKGDYVMPVLSSFLCDGEKLLGRLPEFTITTNMYDMFGDGFIGVGSDQPVFNDKSLLFKAHYSPSDQNHS